ncbi:hydroxymethylbilane synthase [Nakamurella endophytica]|uniref:Porphobilinogen deaminase n=1 Tax=Nakamurella endophytica TaxID=1748367 RepID=A0A917SL33_9ACTN|nr:hydroxymethylbilane synthase [Nakamurella endophytica]GGL84657.1 porphobilinogen deaminase [Nakamurella endophytica]
MTATTTTLRVGTRGSALALAQSGQVADWLSSTVGVPAELVRVRTEGDVDRGPLATIGGTGVFVTGVRARLLSGEVDVVVHSLKDLPTAAADGIALAAVPRREDPADVLCARDGLTLAELPDGARVGTGSPRRAAQLRAARPDLDVRAVRGNVDTRLGMVADGTLDAVVLAAAGLARIGREDAVTERFTEDVMLPAPGQGALAVECRLADRHTGPYASALARLDDPVSRAEVRAERSLLGALEAGCSAPVGARAHSDGVRLTLTGLVIAPDGRRQVRGEISGRAADAALLGRRLAQRLFDDGAAALLGDLPLRAAAAAGGG